MKIKAFISATAITLMAITVAGCSSQSNNSDGNTQKKNSSSSTSTSSVAKKAAPLWNNSKDDKLESYMTAFAGSRNESLKKYSGKGAMASSTVATYPKDLNKAKVNGSRDTIGWSKAGNGKYDYNVVAIYDYDNAKAALPSHLTYFFAFHGKKPVVLSTRSQSSKPALSLASETSLQSDFSKIAKNQSYKNPTVGNMQNYQPSDSQKNESSDSSEQSVTDPKLIGLMTYAYVGSADNIPENPGLFMYTLDDGRYEMDTGSDFSEVTYKLEGNVVHYWTRDFSSSDTIATMSKKEETVNLKELISKYYSSDEQKQNLQISANNIQEQ